MTIHKVAVIECDGCGATALPETMAVADLIRMVDRPSHAGDARQHAHAKGWSHGANGKDLCSNCRPTPTAPAKIHIPHPFHGWGHR